jgi:DMSO/TMAO reductase YedYZ molybdopterin-dependent catalytic subunit
VPDFDPATWDFRVGGLVEHPLTLSWPELLALPRREVTSDFHCVTRWSTFDNRWEGVPIQAVLERVRPQREATHVMVCGHKGEARYGYTTNLPLADLDRPDVLLVLRNNGKDLDPEHGGPLRLVCRTSTPGRARSGCAASSSWTRTSRLLGARRIPHARRSLRGGTVRVGAAVS